MSKKETLTGQQLVLAHIFKAAGGPGKVAEIVGLYRQAPINWRTEGHVPLKWVGQVARALEVSPWALNFTDLANLKGEAPKWADVVKSLGWPKKLVAEILFLSPPENPLIMSANKSSRKKAKPTRKEASK